jgi:hypothetical protein
LPVTPAFSITKRDAAGTHGMGEVLMTYKQRIKTLVVAGAIVLGACGGKQIDIGTGKNPLVGAACDPSQCGANTLTCSGGAAPTGVVCSLYGSACAWSGTCPGDCNPAKCADYGVACADGTPTNLRCAHDPFAGQGSAPADQCEILFDCTGDLGRDGGADAVADAGSACTMDKCAGQSYACSTGPAANRRCVPDPNAGIGSNPVGHCVLEADCPPDTSSDASATFDASVD